MRCERGGMEQDLKKAGLMLKEKGIRQSQPRLMLLDLLTREYGHFTAEELYECLRETAPALSKTTVYNTLEHFVQAGLARRLTVRQGEALYEAARPVHAHFICERCSRIVDVPMDMDALLGQVPSGYEILRKEVYFRGVCPQCDKR